jgi:hypothetical protein
MIAMDVPTAERFAIETTLALAVWDGDQLFLPKEQPLS